MKSTDSAAFNDLMGELARYYRQAKPDEQTIADYFKQLSFFPIEFVDEAVQRAPGLYPSFFPRVGELIQICQALVEEVRQAEKHRPDQERQQYERMKRCEHEYEYQEESAQGLAESKGFLVGFNVCIHCNFARPVFNQSIQYAKHRSYLKQGMEARAHVASPHL